MMPNYFLCREERSWSYAALADFKRSANTKISVLAAHSSDDSLWNLRTTDAAPASFLSAILGDSKPRDRKLERHQSDEASKPTRSTIGSEGDDFCFDRPARNRRLNVAKASCLSVCILL